ncbi:hypothetical protein ACFVFI_36320 [Streptomyces sp. NPDC057705]|uniref:hypothetical protein n=1 Tax=Streptomyces sp. NPDC057705 TaxID=3346222 RepID=UPI0036880E6E
MSVAKPLVPAHAESRPTRGARGLPNDRQAAEAVRARIEDSRFPKAHAKRIEVGRRIGADGMRLLRMV